jgi:hypothetical protein
VLGIEPSAPNLQPANPPILTDTPESEKTKYGTKCSGETAISPELQAVIDAWATLPDAVRAGIVAMVKASTKPGT